MSSLRPSRRHFLAGLAGSAFAVGLPARSWSAWAAPRAYRRSMSTMGTLATITVFDEPEPRAREAVRDAFAEMRRVDALMSTHRRYSPLSRINRMAGNDALAADPRILDVARAALTWHERTEGVFDVTTLPLLRAWGFRDAEGRPAPDVEAALELVGSRFIRIEGDRLGLTRSGAEIDFGGIAKGYAVDRAVARLRDHFGVRRAIVEAGGDLYALGRPEDDEGWTIGVRHPLRDGAFACTFKLADAAVATSGATATRRTTGGREHGDIFDPRDGRPHAPFLSVTGHAATAMDADAVSTAAFIAGRERPMFLSEFDTYWMSTERGWDHEDHLIFTATGFFPWFSPPPRP